MKLNIGFVGTRFAGLDGVSLEADKWDQVLRKMGHKTFWFAGELDKDEKCSFLVEQAHFKTGDNEKINKEIFGKTTRTPQTTKKIHEIKDVIKKQLYNFINEYNINVIIAENCLSIPMHIPLAVALTEVIAETGMPVIGHHHDFSWERDRFIINAVNDYLNMSFPPDLPTLRHVVINTMAQKELSMRRGVSSILIPNVVDFSRDPETTIDKEKAEYFREDFGFTKEDILFLQPTRIVPRKGIEHAINLVKQLNDPRIKLLITHSKGDEGMQYHEWITENARQQGVEIHFLENKLHNGADNQVERVYSLWDIYPHVDFITYPSLFEGFGNAFLEAVYYRKPILVNRYPIFISDIETKGFEVVSMEGYIKNETVERVRQLLGDEKLRKDQVNKNFQLGKKHFSYDLLVRRLKSLFISFYGML